MKDIVATGIIFLCICLGLAACSAVNTYEKIEIAKLECSNGKLVDP